MQQQVHPSLKTTRALEDLVELEQEVLGLVTEWLAQPVVDIDPCHVALMMYREGTLSAAGLLEALNTLRSMYARMFWQWCS